MPGITVELLREGEQRAVETFTQPDGTYRFENVPSGSARITFRAINFTTVRENVVVSAGETVTVDAMLRVAYSADITITAEATFRNIAELEDPAANIVGVASAGSEGAITAAQLEARPIMRPAEVLETVPGLIVSQHSGEGKANQYYLRGFNLDHGSDFATTIAGLPINMPTHAHAHGYSDTNFLIPELVSGVQFRKGPYYAEAGDFSSAGAANINYKNYLDRPLLSLSGGSQGWRRFFGAVSPQIAGGHLLAALDLGHNDGPWLLPDDYKKINGVLRYSRGDTRNGFSITGLGYSANWNATDQVPQRAIDSGLISRFGNIDPTDNGHSFRYSLIGDMQRSGGNDSTRVTAWVQRYGLNLVQNFTYFLDDPVDGDQKEQEDRRVATGGRATYRRLGSLGRWNTQNAIGAEVRHDALGNVALYRTVGGRRTSAIREDQGSQTSWGLFGESEIEWTRYLRTTVGLRGDVFRYNVISDNPENSGTEYTGVVSPKASAVLGPWAGTEIYLNGGFGFHSNNALGATLHVDPVTGEHAEQSTPIVHARGAEIGVRTVRIPGVQTTVTLWTLGFDAELLFVGDAGTTEAGRPSRRWGIEWTNYARPHPWVTLDFDLSFSRARFTDEDPAGDRIPGALDRVVSGGVTIEEPEGGAFGSIRLRHFGPRPLIEDSSVQSKSTTLVNGEVGYQFSRHLRLVAEIFNLFDSEVSDIDYFYTSRLPGEPLGGVDDIHTHAALPRGARVGLQFSF